MGMYDSLYVECPKCKAKLEYQSKSGQCCMWNFTKKDLTYEVAGGINGNIVRCQFCNKRIQFTLKPAKPIFKLKILNQKSRFDYDGNYNEKHPYSIKRAKELRKIFAKEDGGEK